MTSPAFAPFADKMKAAGVHDACIRAFGHNYERLVAGDTGMMPEAELEPLPPLPRYRDLPEAGRAGAESLSQCVVIKLNGGLGTSMGLEKAKSLLQVKEGLTFLDFIARQILRLREKHGQKLRFMLMNSFNTSADTVDFFSRYPHLGTPPFIELVQSQAPKVDANTLHPCRWEKNSQLEWCPPGHGDIYPSLFASGRLEELVRQGVRFAFVSNSDNLGATLDLRLLEYFESSGNSFMMEVAERTPSDRKGGHLTRRNGRFALRESAQCPESDTDAFQDISRHQFFNTNNLWIRLDHLLDALKLNGGFLPLPIIRNAKNVDPRDKKSPQVIQLETAMGAAIQCFERAGAVVVPRTRFAPVKTTSDLLALRSDAYRMTDDWRLVLAKDGDAAPPTVHLDPNHYKIVDQLEKALADGVPSLRDCEELSVQGPVKFNSDARFVGKVSLTNPNSQSAELPRREFRNETLTLS